VIEHSAIITGAIITDESPLRVVLYLLVTGEVKLGLSASKLAKAVPMAQQAYLLTALEGFSQGDAARILDVDVVELRALIEQAIRGLGAEPGTDVLIVTDDTFEALQLETLVGHLGHRVAGLAHTHAEAVALAKAKPPGLILVDAEGSFGREVEELLRSFAARMIVVTAAPERFLTGERPEPTFVIGKPLTPPAVAAVASQALFFESLTEHRQALSAKPA
jgi:CheY-like chemotaxis protein